MAPATATITGCAAGDPADTKGTITSESATGCEPGDPAGVQTPAFKPPTPQLTPAQIMKGCFNRGI